MKGFESPLYLTSETNDNLTENNPLKSDIYFSFLEGNGGGGNRTPVRKSLTQGIYMLIS
jgi:hypothetical protein